MNEIIKKEDFLFERDDQGVLVPVQVDLKEPFNYSVMLRPIARGRLLKMFQDAKINPAKDGAAEDAALVLEFCAHPALTADDISRAKPSFITAIAAAIMDLSLGVPAEKPSALEEAESLLKKKSV